MSKEDQDYIALKWGTLKAWDIKTPEVFKLLKKYFELGVSFGAAQQRDTDEQKELLCQAIDASNADEIFLDWDGIYVSKAEAKKYIMEYRRQA